MNRLDEVISRINPGRKVDMNKVCPYIKDKCLGSECNAFSPEFGINVVNQEEVDRYIEQGFDDWQQQLEKDDWVLNTIIEHPMLHTLDQKTYVFTRKNYYSGGEKLGRCIIGGK